MIHKVLALIDRPNGGDECAKTAAQLAMRSRADLILAIDPQEESFASLEAELNHLVDLAVARGAQTSSMLVDTTDMASVVRSIRRNLVDVVVLDGPAEAGLATALQEAHIPFVSAETGHASPA